MTISDRTYLGLHPVGAEQNGECSHHLDGFQQGFPTFRVVAVYYHRAGFFPENYILDGLCPSEESRLEALYLHQHTQQRRDDFFARENQNRTQRNQPK